MKKTVLFIVVIAGLLWAGCNPSGKGQPYILTTTNIIGDCVRQVVGDKVEVRSLMGPGVDPHLYKPLQGDIGQLEHATLIIHNGLHLEGKLSSVLQKMEQSREVIAVADACDPGEVMNHQGAADPHIWFDLQLWKSGMEGVLKKLIEIFPEHKEEFLANWETYKVEIEEIDAWAKGRVKEIPAERRVMVTAHDAFHYFGNAYGIEVRALQGISTLDEFSLKDVNNEVEFLSQSRIPCVFVESSIPQKYMQAVIQGCQSRGHEIKIGGTLYSDAIGAKDTEEGTYLGAFKHNVNTICKGLTQ